MGSDRRRWYVALRELFRAHQRGADDAPRVAAAPSPFCCAWRRKFPIGIVFTDPDAPYPSDFQDKVENWLAGSNGMVIYVGWCPFCGTKLNAQQTRRLPRK